jgi:glycosyltransferase involved in cell wall biosynthesis
VNGVALTCRQLIAHARRRERPLLAFHAGAVTEEFAEGSTARVQLKRSPARFPLDPDFDFDLLYGRHLARIGAAMEAFDPDVVHITGPGDVGLMGALMARRKNIPLVASWHTNVHEFAARRLEAAARKLPVSINPAARKLENFILNRMIWFYRMAQAILAPNRDLCEMLEGRTGRPVFLMPRGVDTGMFAPGRRTRRAGPFTYGYVGRITSEKSVRLLADVERALQAAGKRDYRFVITGHGPEEPWLRRNLLKAEFTGVLRGLPLAEAYANIDMLLFPSRTDAFGNVVQEAQASGVPPLVTNSGGPRFLVRHRVDGFVAESDSDFVQLAVDAMDDPRFDSIRRAARARAETCSWENVFDDVFSVYQRFARRPAPVQRMEQSQCRA